MLTHESKPDLTLIQTLGQTLNEVEFAFKELDGPLYTFEMLDTTVFHGKLWSGTMLEPHEDVGNEVARLIENVATNYYCSARLGAAFLLAARGTLIRS